MKQYRLIKWDEEGNEEGYQHIEAESLRAARALAKDLAVRQGLSSNVFSVEEDV